MPELPEVETIKRVIEPQIKGLTITDVEVRRSGSVLPWRSRNVFLILSR